MYMLGLTCVRLAKMTSVVIKTLVDFLSVLAGSALKTLVVSCGLGGASAVGLIVSDGPGVITDNGMATESAAPPLVVVNVVVLMLFSNYLKPRRGRCLAYEEGMRSNGRGVASKAVYTICFRCPGRCLREARASR